MRIACLHTAESNIAVFEESCRNGDFPLLQLRHEVRPDLLAEVEASGGLTTAIEEKTLEALLALSVEADAVLLTCSSLGPVVARAAGLASSPILRVDEALAREAAESGGTVVALCAVTTTLEPTRALFESAAQGTGATVEVRLVPAAWDLFKAGQRDRYLVLIAEAADHAFGEGVQTVALAQASMTGAAGLCRRGLPLTSPGAGLKAALAMVGKSGKAA
ncbi:aspartate/glutamate racemase family protein [Microvirga splendida]|uniref:Asp/Glu racemase n=1 Tax=Microvirga splendida TaxID=2795727 RepID=A0ABS0Y5X4_9HYPH|nr:aspartate/glutamate racemase family protein [Microvirga splendida]MBJ6127704.1 Asp/Glu racemase [Microvirga splendida]